jgi:ferredoxin-type protein NapH
MSAILLLFLLQYAGIDLVVGSLSGSVVLRAVKLLDVFTFLESQVAAREVASTALIAVFPVVVLYLVFGRAFCGWVCPMDFLFSVATRVRRGGRPSGLSPRIGYVVAGAFLAGALLTETPVFTNYISHLTNFFRALSAAAGAWELPGSLSVLIYSASVISLLLVLELIFPRLWCRVLCPVGKTYGLFNRISLLRLRFTETRCSGCRGCEDVCCMGVEIACHAEGRELRDANCIYCGRCVEVCGGKEDVVRMGFRR